MHVKTIAVIGAGAMCRGIALASVLGGFRTILEDISPQVLEQGLSYIREMLDQAVAVGKISSPQEKQALAQLTSARRVEDACRNADLIIETVPEELEVKLEIFTILDKFAKPNAILASNTSSLSITDLAEITFRPEDCVGMRFFHPVTESKRLEIVRGLETSDATISACAEVGRRMGMEVILLKESPQAQEKSA